MGSNWHGDDFFNGVVDRITKNVGKAANGVRDYAKQLIGIQGPPRSLPGEPPHMDTTRLMNSVEVIGPAAQNDLVFASIGTSVPYGKYLEFGTTHTAARPWLVRSLRERQDATTKTIAYGTDAPMAMASVAHEGAD